MTLPIFNLGDEVEVIGTSAKFTITQIQQLPDDERKYSDIGMPYYRAGFLRLVNEKPLSPMQVTCTYDPVDCECRAIQVSCPCGRKTEIALPEKSEWKEVPDELKIGDWVEHDDIVFQIADISEGEPYYLHRSGKIFEKWYHPSALRKLTPEEIQQCQTTQMLPKPTEIQELRRRIHDLEMSLDGFTNGPEPEYVSGILHVKDPIRKRLSAIEKRLAFVEKFQRDQDDLVGRAIRDGVAEILDFRRK